MSEMALFNKNKKDDVNNISKFLFSGVIILISSFSRVQDVNCVIQGHLTSFYGFQ